MSKRSRPSLARRTRLVESLPPLEEVVRGSVFERRRRCGKPSCHCARGEGHRSFYLAVAVGPGKTEQISLPADLAPLARRWVKNYRRTEKILEKISAINRAWLRAERDARKQGSERR